MKFDYRASIVVVLSRIRFSRHMGSFNSGLCISSTMTVITRMTAPIPLSLVICIRVSLLTLVTYLCSVETATLCLMTMVDTRVTSVAGLVRMTRNSVIAIVSPLVMGLRKVLKVEARLAWCVY